MPRLIILLLTLTSLAILTVQNLGVEKAVALVILGRPIAAIPLGLLLLAAIGLGALTTLLMYGLIGLRRPAESKYKPMGTRVPYPEPGSTSTYDGPSTSSSAGSTYDGSATSKQYGSGNSAFVTEPPADRAGAAPRSFVSSPPDSPSSGTTPSSSVYSPFSRSENRADAADQTAAEKKKASLRVESPDPNLRNQQTETDWATFRPAARRDRWDGSNDSASASPQQPEKKGLFDFVKGMGISSNAARQDAGQLADDIGSGWQDGPAPDRYAAQYGEEGRVGEGSSVENRYPNSSYEDDLDRGWEGADRTGTTPLNYDAPAYGQPDYGQPSYERKVYGEDLYGQDPYPYDPESPYDPKSQQPPYDEPVEEGPEESSDPDVYEADYRVIVPPSRPLEDDAY